MTTRKVLLEPMVREKAAQLGDEGMAWLSSLPELITDLESKWSITVGEPLSGGTAAYVAQARTAEGRDVVVKLAVPDVGSVRQIHTLAAARGHGYVALLAHDVSHHASLLETMGPSLNRRGLPPEKQIDALCDLLALAWRVPVADMPPEPIRNKARELAGFVARLWKDLGQPCSERVLAHALEYAQRRAAAFDPNRCVIVHGDAGAGNALQVLAPRAGAELGLVFVDPDGFLGDPAYDLGVILRDWSRELLAGDAPSVARGYCRRIADRTGFEESAIWEWGFLERVSTGLYALSLGAGEVGRLALASAEALL